MKCSLRLMREVDLERVLNWRNHPDVRKNMYTDHEITWEEHQLWWEREKGSSYSVLLIAEINEEPVGVVTFTNISNVCASATWAFYSGNTKNRGIGSHMEQAALEFAFINLKLNRLECEVLEFNYPVVEFHRKFGFELEGVKRDAFYREGTRYDIYCLSLLQKNWLRSKEKPSKKLPKVIEKMITVDSNMVQGFSSVSGDLNAIHLDDEAAVASGFEKRIAHGMLSGSLFSHMFTKNPFESGTIYLSQSLKFLSPVYVDQTVQVTLKLISQQSQKAIFKTTIEADGILQVVGEAIVLLPRTHNDN